MYDIHVTVLIKTLNHSKEYFKYEVNVSPQISILSPGQKIIILGNKQDIYRGT